MTLQEIIATESRNTDRIYLHREGVFWKVYDQSAFAFIHRVSRYRATKRFVKYLDAEVVTIGFPDASRQKVLGDRPILSEAPDMLLLQTTPIDPDEYANWKQALPLATPKFQSSAAFQSYTTPANPGAGPASTASAAAAPSIPRPASAASAIRPTSAPSAVSAPRPHITLIEPGSLQRSAPPPHSSSPTSSSPPAQPASDMVAQRILSQLREFSIENATPLECLLFVSSLKKQLHGDLR